MTQVLTTQLQADADIIYLGFRVCTFRVLGINTKIQFNPKYMDASAVSGAVQIDMCEVV